MSRTTKAKETEPEEAASEEEASQEWPHHIENDWVLNRLPEAEIDARMANAGLSPTER